MQITNFAALFLSAISLSSAAAIHPRIITADTIIQDVNNINDGVVANQKATEAYEGGNLVTTLVQGTPVFVTVGAIHVANRKGFVDANLAPKFNEADTRRIFNSVTDTVGVSIPNDVELLISKKPEFESSGLVPVVEAGLKLLLNDHDTFSAAVEAKAYMGNAELTAEGVAVVAKIHDAIQRGIDVYAA